MKKFAYLFFLILTLFNVLLIASFPKKALAQGTFECKKELSGVAGECIIDDKNSNCDNGYVPDSNSCKNMGYFDCITRNDLPCKELSPSAATSLESALSSTKTSGSINVLCDDNVSITTAIGCINVLENIDTSMGGILRFAIGIGGGIAFLLILYAGFMIMTSQGNPDRLKAGQELLTSAISGLLLLILSVFLLNFVGINILGIFT